MKLETKLDVGDVIWVPRVYVDRKADCVVIDGKTYWASHEDATVTYEPRVKKKVITNIDIEIGSEGTKIVYWTKGDTDTYSCITDKSVYFTTEQEALEFAAAKAEKGEEYHGY